MRIAIVEDELSQQTLLVRTLEQQLERDGPVNCQAFLRWHRAAERAAQGVFRPGHPGLVDPGHGRAGAAALAACLEGRRRAGADDQLQGFRGGRCRGAERRCRRLHHQALSPHRASGARAAAAQARQAAVAGRPPAAGPMDPGPGRPPGALPGGAGGRTRALHPDQPGVQPRPASVQPPGPDGLARPPARIGRLRDGRITLAHAGQPHLPVAQEAAARLRGRGMVLRTVYGQGYQLGWAAEENP
jgi:hypothetical protein